jgi:hypothetical protein
MTTIKDRLITFKNGLITAKNNLASAITAKGVSASGTNTFADFVSKIGNISTSDATMLIPIGTRLLFNNEPDIFENGYGKFVKTGAFVDTSAYPALSSYASEAAYSDTSIIPAMSANSQDGWSISASGFGTATGEYYYMVDNNSSTRMEWKYASNSSSNATTVKVSLIFPISYKIGKIQSTWSYSFSTSNNYGVQIIKVNNEDVTIPAKGSGSSSATFSPIDAQSLTIQFRSWASSGDTGAYSRITNIDIFSVQNKVPLETYTDGRPLYIRYA